jgi:pyrimidine operon attenuation protein / uracil phosphoribosyltransferase
MPTFEGMNTTVLFDEERVKQMVARLALHITEDYTQIGKLAIIGIQPRGVHLANRIASELKHRNELRDFEFGTLDPTFFRDDFRRRNSPLQPSETVLPFLTENKNVLLIDDVLFTGRTIRASLDALQSFGRPSSVRLLCLIDRKYSRELPVQADYTGAALDTFSSTKVRVLWKELHNQDAVVLSNDSTSQSSPA